MAQTVTINKVSYPDVPYVMLNKTDGTGQAKYVDSSDATATSSDLRIGKSAYINGEKVEGAIPETDSLTYDTGIQMARSNFDVAITTTQTESMLVNGGATVKLEVPLKDFGEANGADVISGVTFTGNGGYKITGSLPLLNLNKTDVPRSYETTDDGFNIVYRFADRGYTTGVQDLTLHLTNEQLREVLGLYESLLSPSLTVLGITGTFTADATATASQLQEGKTAYVNGQRVIGTLPEFASGTHQTGVADPNSVIDGGANTVRGTLTWVQDAVVRSGHEVNIQLPYDEIADAIGLTPDMIKTGESVLSTSGTFTSDATATANDILVGETAYVNGQKLTGTYQPLDTSDATATAADILEGKTAYINGQKVVGTMKIATTEEITGAFNTVFGA